MTDYDSPWKELLDQFFQNFLQFCFPSVASAIDWEQEFVMRDKELQQIAPQSSIGRRTLDKLVEVRTVSGSMRWLLIHLEVQSQWEEDFAERMFVYFYPIRDKYRKRIVSLVVFADNHPKWRPNCFREKTLGCSIAFRYPTVKLKDFSDRLAQLEESDDPMATLIAAHLHSLETTNNAIERSQSKIRLVRKLYERGMDAQRLRHVFRLLDWLMELPPDLEFSFRNELHQIEESMHMPYITSIERLAKQEGHLQGREEGIVAGKIQLLEQILGEPEQAIDSLLARPLAELQADLDRLTEKLRSRNN